MTMIPLATQECARPRAQKRATTHGANELDPSSAIVNFCARGRAHSAYTAGSLILLLISLLAAGCSLKQPHAEKHSFTLEATRTATARALSLPVQVQVRLATINPPFDGQAFTYRTSDLGYKSDFYNGFVTSPNALLTAQLQSWLSAAKLFHSVLPATSSLPVTHTLETQVLTLHGDFRNPSAPKAILEARFLLLNQRRATPSAVFDKSYREEIPFTDPQPDALARAWSQALGKIFTALEADLSTTEIH